MGARLQSCAGFSQILAITQHEVLPPGFHRKPSHRSLLPAKNMPIYSRVENAIGLSPFCRADADPFTDQSQRQHYQRGRHVAQVKQAQQSVWNPFGEIDNEKDKSHADAKLQGAQAQKDHMALGGGPLAWATKLMKPDVAVTIAPSHVLGCRPSAPGREKPLLRQKQHGEQARHTCDHMRVQQPEQRRTHRRPEPP